MTSMTDYQELHELACRRADICEGQILELRRRTVALETELDRLRRDKLYYQTQAYEKEKENRRLRRKNKKLKTIVADGTSREVGEE